VFLTLLEVASFKAASAHLGVNSSTVGRRLDALEAVLGVKLFERSRSGVVATDAARTLEPAARHFGRAAAAFEHATGTLESEPAGRVVISAPMPVANHLLVPVLTELEGHYPDLQVVVDTSNAFVDLDKHEADLALRGSGTREALRGGGTLLARRLWRSSCVPVASTAYAAELGTLADLDAARWVTFGDRNAGLRWARRVLDNVSPGSIVMRSDDASTVLAATVAGVGATWVTRPFCGLGLVELPLTSDLQPLISEDDEELWLVVHRSLRDVPRVAAVWSFLLEALAR
jgi:DNA-binding transcriptional LysR family regulator